MATQFDDIEILNAATCELCVFGTGSLAYNNLRSVAALLPPRARVVLIDEETVPPWQAANDNRMSSWLARIANSLISRFWAWRTESEISVRYGCRVLSCEEHIGPNGKLHMVIYYHNEADPENVRVLRAERVIWTLGFANAQKTTGSSER